MQRSILHLGRFYPSHLEGMETHIQNLVSVLSGSEDVRMIVPEDTIRGRIDEMGGVVISRVATLGVVASMQVTPPLPWELLMMEPTLVHAHGIAAAYFVEKSRETTKERRIE